MPTISTNKRYENLAASIGSTNETFNQSYPNDFDSSEAPTFLGCFKLPVPPEVREASNNHTSPAGRLESHQRGFWVETPFQMQKTKALGWLFPECVRRVEKQSTKAGRFLVLGVHAQEMPGGTPEVWSHPGVCQLPPLWPCHGWGSSRLLPAPT